MNLFKPQNFITLLNPDEETITWSSPRPRALNHEKIITYPKWTLEVKLVESGTRDIIDPGGGPLNLVSYKILKTRIRNLGHTSTKNFKSILGSDELACRCEQKLRFHRSRRAVQNSYAEELQVFFIHLAPKHMAEESSHRVDGSVRITEVLTLCFSSPASCLGHFRWLSKFLP